MRLVDSLPRDLSQSFLWCVRREKEWWKGKEKRRYSLSLAFLLPVTPCAQLGRRSTKTTGNQSGDVILTCAKNWNKYVFFIPLSPPPPNIYLFKGPLSLTKSNILIHVPVLCSFCCCFFFSKSNFSRLIFPYYPRKSKHLMASKKNVLEFALKAFRTKSSFRAIP